MKYKQKIIPEITTPKEWRGKKISELRKLALEKARILFTRNSDKETEVINEHLKVCIHIKGGGLRKTSYGEAMYFKKAVALLILADILRYAEYSNWGDRKESDDETVVGYLNFKVKCRIDGILEHLRIAVQFKTDGNFYYNIEVNTIKK